MLKKATALTFLLVFFAAGTGFCQDVAKIGVVDLQKIIDTSAAGKEALAEIKTNGEKMEAELQKKAGAIEELKKTLERKAMVMNRETRDQNERELRIAINDLKYMQQKYMEDFKRLEAKLVNRIKDEVFVIVKELGKKDGFLLVLERREAGILYSPASLDITDKVIKEYDARQPKK